MNEWILLLVAALAGSVVSLAGGVYLLYGKWGAGKLQRIAVPFAAGALLAAAFLDLIPEAFHDSDPHVIAMIILGAFLVFFLLERSLSWFHHHHDEREGDGAPRHRRNAPLIIIGDTLHNFIDGLAIGASFLVSPATGIITTIAIAAHEVPQEIGDFGLLLSKGMSKKRVLLVNFFSAAVTIIGAVLVFGFGNVLSLPIETLLAVTAGFFIYIAASDIIPTIHAETKRSVANLQAAILLVGVVFVGATTTIAHQYIGGHDHHEESGHHHEDHDHEIEQSEDH